MTVLDTEAAAAAAAPDDRRRRRPMTGSLLVGGFIVMVVFGLALLSFVWTPHDPTLVNPSARLEKPSLEYWFGTDKFGRDVFSQILMGSRTTLFVGFVAVGVAALIGVPLGIVAGMAPGWVGELLMRGNDLLLAFPALLLAIMFAAVYGASTLVAMVAIGIASIPHYARLIRGGTLQVMNAEYVVAARAAGRGPFSIGLRHVLPNVSSLVIVQASVGFAIAVLAEAALSFLGFGTPPPTPSWGRMLQESQEMLSVAPRLAVFPGIAIAVVVLGFNLLGDGLRDRFDPKLEDHR
ncbi:ABC transporter permease [Streptomyces rapamycinicus]|uniref:Peptide ABC transporter permease n=2 Tax=Streptomyces rapamycinicus TaxID=1226757 RepID=A0A0A0NU18_STRRN|nr:ABC transporter permease [Streptomyces rapamycinicus]AGP61066.1 peptide ABC transporter permease [Streptomyces rapamycinicus NRRL 5491]MBB4787758.1 peptide/nickel transport system permease protein [Streptomyces rapamycinicus]RLV72097.1 peptide ABC transporter permease [Streptomyces rapamycinicus NRRL 5491]UTP36582.1 ABC transporter permease [Streptomyces rapamycinicus NRRL 5491]